MHKQRNTFGAGIFALASIALFAALALWFAAGGVWPGGTTTLQVLFEEAPGVRPGADVLVSGVRAGRVRDVRFADPVTLRGGVVVSLALNGNAQIPRGSHAVATPSPWQRGGAVVELVPAAGDLPLLESGARILGESASGLSSALPPELVASLDRAAARIGDTARRMGPVMDDLHDLLAERSPDAVQAVGGPAPNLRSAVTRLDATLRNVHEHVGSEGTQQQIAETLADLKAISGDARAMAAELRTALGEVREAMGSARSMMSAGQSAFNRIDAQLAASSERWNQTLDLAIGILGQLYPAAAKIGRGEGSLGKLIMDDQMYETMLLTLRRAGEP